MRINGVRVRDSAVSRLACRLQEQGDERLAFYFGHVVDHLHDQVALTAGDRQVVLRALVDSSHSLRHSAGSVWLTEYGLPVTTVSAMMGHANPSFTLACYGRDPRDTETMVADVLARAAAVGT